MLGMCCGNGGYVLWKCWVCVVEMGGMCCGNGGYVSVAEMGGMSCVVEMWGQRIYLESRSRRQHNA